MGVFGPGFLLDPSTMLPVAGRVVAVTDPDTGEPVTTTEADGTTPRTVVTNLRGHYPQFHVAGTWAVLLSAGGVEEVVAAIDRSGSGIEYVSGVVTPDPAVAVHEYFTTGPATIDGVEYDTEQAVVLFRIQGSWVHRVVDIPQPLPDPTVTLLKTYVATDIPTGGTKQNFTFSGGGATVPADGVLVVAASTWAESFSAITVGGASLTYAAQVHGANNLTPHIYCAPVTAGAGLDVEITTNTGTSCLGISVILVTNAAPVPYAVKDGTYGPGTVPESPAGSVIISQRTSRPDSGTTQGWEPEFTEVDNTTFPTNGASAPMDGWTTWHRNAWGFSTGDPGQVDFEGSGDHAMIVLSRSES